MYKTSYMYIPSGGIGQFLWENPDYFVDITLICICVGVVVVGYNTAVSAVSVIKKKIACQPDLAIPMGCEIEYVKGKDNVYRRLVFLKRDKDLEPLLKEAKDNNTDVLWSSHDKIDVDNHDFLVDRRKEPTIISCKLDIFQPPIEFLRWDMRPAPEVKPVEPGKFTWKDWDELTVFYKKQLAKFEAEEREEAYAKIRAENIAKYEAKIKSEVEAFAQAKAKAEAQSFKEVDLKDWENLKRKRRKKSMEEELRDNSKWEDVKEGDNMLSQELPRDNIDLDFSFIFIGNSGFWIKLIFLLCKLIWFLCGEFKIIREPLSMIKVQFYDLFNGMFKEVWELISYYIWSIKKNIIYWLKKKRRR